MTVAGAALLAYARGRTMKLLLALVLGTSLVACKKEPPAETAPVPPAVSMVDAGPPARTVESAVMAVFVGNDSRAMAGIGHELESKRPPVTVELLKQMLVELRRDPGQDEQVRKMRPLLFRSVAVLVGRPALPLLSDCVATLKDVSQLCGGALQEIETAK